MRFWQQPNLLLCLWAGVGLHWLWSHSRLSPCVLKTVCWAVVAAQLCLHFQEMDEHSNWTFREMAQSILNTLPQNSVFLARGDLDYFGTRYLQQCEGQREDLHLLSRPMLGYPWMARTLRRRNPEVILPGDIGNAQFFEINPEGYKLLDFFRANEGKFIFFASQWGEDEETSWQRDYQNLPMGFITGL